LTYRLCKARLVVDKHGSGAVAVEGGSEGEEGEKGKALVAWVVHALKQDLFPSLVELLG
jgi:hypothetical protein